MRKQLLKLKRGISTKAERQFAEVLKNGRIPFKAKVIVKGREVDFIIGKYAIDIDGHDQDPGKNVHLVKAGYIPIHFSNKEIFTLNEKSLTNKLILILGLTPKTVAKRNAIELSLSNTSLSA